MTDKVRCLHIDITWIWPEVYKGQYDKVVAKCNICNKLLVTQLKNLSEGGWATEEEVKLDLRLAQ